MSEVRPEAWAIGGLENHHEESWRKFKMCQIWSNTAATGLCIPDLEQHRCNNRTVYGSFHSKDSRSGATLLLRECVRVNSFGTGSQHIPDLEQHPYHMLVISFVRFDNSSLKQHRCYGTVYGSIRSIMYYRGRQGSHDFIVDLGITHVPMDASNIRPKRACRVMDLRSPAVPSL